MEGIEMNQQKLYQFMNMIGEKEVNSHTVHKIIQFICHEFNFDVGCVYDVNQYHEVLLHEYEALPQFALKDKFNLEILSKYSFFKEGQLHIYDNQELLDYFMVSSLCILPFYDDVNQIFGFILFANTKEIDRDNSELLEMFMKLFVKYMSIRMYQNKVEFVKNSLQSIIDNTGIDIYVNDFHTHEVLYVNKSMAAPYGGVEEFMKHKCWETLFPGQKGPCEFCPEKQILDENGEPTKIYTWDYQRAFDGSWFRVFSAAFQWLDGRIAHVVSSANITDNKKNEEKIQYLANYDSLTNLPNRRMLISECDRRINQTSEGDQGYILFFDIDGFKLINDNYGHDAGDDFLIQLGSFFLSIPLLENAIYRNGGDEFIAIIDGDKTEVNIRSLAQFILKRFEKPWNLKAGDVYCNISIGVARYPEDGKTSEELLHIADKAMYQVKKNGGANILFGYELEKGNYE